MKYIQALLFTIIAFFSIQSCKESIRAEGEIIEKESKQEAFKSIELDGNFHIVLLKDTLHRLTIETTKNLVENISVTNDDGKITIKEKQTVIAPEIYKLYLYVKDVESIKLKGNVKMDVSGELRNNDMTIHLYDNSEFIGKIINQKLDLKVNDNAKLNLNGTIVDAEINLKGNSELFAPTLIVSNLEIDLSGNSKARLQIIKSLDGKGTDNSILEYIGNPDKDFQNKDNSKIEKVDTE